MIRMFVLAVSRISLKTNIHKEGQYHKALCVIMKLGQNQLAAFSRGYCRNNLKQGEKSESCHSETERVSSILPGIVYLIYTIPDPTETTFLVLTPVPEY